MSDDLTTVKEMIEILKTFPEDLPVLVSGYNSGYECICLPEIAELVHCSENTYRDGEYQLANDSKTFDLTAVVIDRMCRDD